MPQTLENQLKLLQARKEKLFLRVQYTFELIPSLPKNEGTFLSRAQMLDATFKEFDEVLNKLFEVSSQIPEAAPVNMPQICQSFEELYFVIKAKAEEITVQRQKTEVKAAATPQIECNEFHRPKLPEIKIAPFSGQIDKFPSFISLFNTLVHNVKTLSEIEKFSYLKTLLIHSASQTLDSVEFKPENYNLAYEKLVQRFTNKRIVASHYLNKIINFKPFTTDSPTNLRAFLDTFHDNFSALTSLELENLSDFIMLHLGLKGLDKNTRRQFEIKLQDKDFPSFKDLCTFIETHLRVSELCGNDEAKAKTSALSTSSPKVYSISKTTSSNEKDTKLVEPTPSCPVCKADHKVLMCPIFLNSAVSERYDLLKKSKRCFSCAGGHMLSDCKSKSSCRVCRSKKHNTLLHHASSSGDRSGKTTTNGADSSDSGSCSSPLGEKISVSHCEAQSLSSQTKFSQVLLSTALASIRSQTGEWVTCRIIVDPGSQVNLISRKLVNKLGLPRSRRCLTVSGIGQTRLPVSQFEVSCVLSPLKRLSPLYKFSAMVLPSISSSTPSLTLPQDIIKRLSSLELSDPHFHQPGPVDLLIGAQVYSEILTDPIQFSKGNPSAMQTSLGWIVFGKVNSNEPALNANVHSFHCVADLQDDLKRFWESEEIEIQIPENPEYQFCEQYFQATTQQDEQGRFVVSLPFRQDIPLNLPSTREIALSRLLRLETRFKRDPLYKELYSSEIHNYISSNHVRRTTTPSSYVITHHGVLKESTSTQLRVVFNGSERTQDSNSLNDCLLAGKPLQTDIGHLIDNFRTFPVAFTCDVKQMFRNIRLHPSDRELVHFFWRDDPSCGIDEYELTTLPFGLKSSPFLAQRVIVELFHRFSREFPRAALCLPDIYVDNVVTGAASVEDALILYDQLVSLFSRGGFTLRKFSSNKNAVLRRIPKDHRDQPLNLDDSNSIKVLGLHWNPKTDSLCYRVDYSNPVHSKRGILSLVARIFDVNGYLSPVTFSIKCLLQSLWLLKIDWDDRLPSDISSRWSHFLEELPVLKEVSLPRFVLGSPTARLSLAAFSDASEKGFGCVFYLMVEESSGTRSTHLIKAKSKVAPLKVISIPRLELNAALLLSKVLHSLRGFIDTLSIDQIFCFSDSKNVLCWLQTPPYKLKPYVANRLTQILENTKPGWWNYIRTHSNPADPVSRGLTPRQLVNNSLYWNGPEFLSLPLSEWPILPLEPASKVEELKAMSLLSQPQLSFPLDISSFSSLVRLQRVLAFVLRFIQRLKFRLSSDTTTTIPNSLSTSTFPDFKSSSALTVSELQLALETCVRQVQQENFPELWKNLQDGRPISGTFGRLAPFLSETSLIRVGGRLGNSSLPESAKHPILIPKGSHLASLICDHYHKYSLHGGSQLVQSLIHRRFWIPSLRSLIRKCIFRCITCYKSKAKPIAPLMADLPSFRVTQARAFQEVGVDYAGPMLYKESKRKNSRKYKCWISLFVCMATKAVHLELVSDLSAQSFISTFDRFIARRGLPKRIHSDCGSNFVGASRKLKEIYEFVSSNSDAISSHLSSQDIDWKFIPPASPHFGGLWESAVKSVKGHLTKVVQNHAFTFEEYSTLLARIEALLNSRPLCGISNNPTDNLDYLSPGHFLIGQALVTRPESEESPTFSLTSRWELVSKALRHFWKRWHHEYLHTLMPRPKWWQETDNLRVGTLVVLHEKTSPPEQWTLARIVEVLPGPDGVVRVVKVRTSSGLLLRPVHKVLPLPVAQTS